MAPDTDTITASRKPLKSTSGFLPHIAGLRAVAIILVVLFHLDGSAWAHGYLGVDIFLVISGYMLFRTRLRQSEPYGIKDSTVFLYKRFLRIVPPMAVTLLLTIALGILLMGAEDLAFLCGLSGYSLVGAANFSLRWSFEDYFAQDAAFIPLLHFWYLAVILQVYLLWAVGNYLIQRLPKGMVIAILVALGLASLAYCYSFSLHEWLKSMGISWWEQDKAPSYYQTLPRVWEILAGGLICVLPSARNRAVAAALSLLGLLSIILFSLSDHIPGASLTAALPSTLFVVGGTVLLIRYLPESGLNKLLANAPLVRLGGISFSIYLVHMPIIFFWKLWQFGQMDTWDKLGAFLLSIPLGYAFWWCIEKRRFTWWLTALLWLAAMGAALYGKKTNGFEWVMQDAMPIKPSYDRWKLNTDPALEVGLSKEIVPSLQVFKLMNMPCPNRKDITTPLMFMGDYSQKPSIVLMGDSHGSHFYPGFDQILKKEKLAGIYYSPVVVPLHHCTYDLHIDYSVTPQKEDALMEWLSEHPELKHIIIAQRWTTRIKKHAQIGATKDFVYDLRQFLQRLKDMEKKIILIAPTPEFSSNTPLHFYKVQMVRHVSWESVHSKFTKDDYLNENAEILSIMQQMSSEGLCTIIEPIKCYRSDEDLLPMDNNVLYMKDSNHMTARFSIWLTQRLFHQLQYILKDY